MTNNEIERNLVNIFHSVSRLARIEPDLDKVSKLWGAMAQLCYVYPDDERITQMKQRCERLQVMHA